MINPSMLILKCINGHEYSNTGSKKIEVHFLCLVIKNIFCSEAYAVELRLYFYNNNQPFYSQVSWGRLGMKPHE
jgi:hypothetical protein